MLPSFIQRDNCTGCGGCSNVCSSNAISLCEEGTGDFLYPNIDYDKCTNCNMCKNVCPVVQEKKKSQYKSRCFSAWAENDIRLKSSSGGAFTVLANNMLSNDGIVCGVTLDNNFKCEFICIENSNDLNLLLKSKYVQANPNMVYKQIGIKLKNGKHVLFSGCGCHNAALRNYLKILNISTEKLTCINIFCFGVPSNKMLVDYIDELSRSEKIKSIDFRDKALGEQCICLTVNYENGNKKSFSNIESEYEYGFHNCIILRDSCYNCKFCEPPFEGDISIGDFWGIERYRPDWRDGKGTSLVVINSEKGLMYFESCKQNFARVEELPLDYICNRTEAIKKIPNNRPRFFDLLKQKSFCESINYVKNNKYDIGIVGLWFFTNHGTEMTYLALYNVIKELGYSPLIISQPLNSVWKPTKKPLQFNKSPYNDFDFAKFYGDKQSMSELNNICRMFCLGSDQWLNNDIYKLIGEFSTLEWVNNSKYKMSYAASFGKNEMVGTEQENSKMMYYIKHFDAFSVREKSSKLMFQKSGVDYPVVLDPVFLCDKRIYDALAEDGTTRLPDKKFICAYILDPNKDKENLINSICKSTNLNAFGIVDGHLVKSDCDLLWSINCLFDVTNEEWMAYYKNCDMVITDSFHGMCFAIIFKKQFIAVINEFRGKDRFIDLASQLGLEDRIINSSDLLNNDLLNNKINYDNVYDKLDKLKEFSINWLKTKIEEGLNKERSLDDTSILRSEIYEEHKLINTLKADLKNETANNETRYNDLLLQYNAFSNHMNDLENNNRNLEAVNRNLEAAINNFNNIFATKSDVLRNRSIFRKIAAKVYHTLKRNFN